MGLSALVAEFRSERVTTRTALLFGTLTGLLGVALAASQLANSPQLDYHAYYFAGRAVLEGEPFVGTAIHEGSFLTEKEYVYTPVTAPVFLLYGLFPRWQFGYVLNIALLLVVFYLVARLTVRHVEGLGVDLKRMDRWLILSFSLFSGHTILGLYRGNVDPVMLLLVTVGFLAVERGDQLQGGVAWAVAALFKLFPAFLGLWLLYRRAYRAAAAAIVTGLGMVGVGVVLFGVDAHVAFVEFILNERSRKAAFEGGLEPEFLTITLRRPLSQFLALSGNELIVVSTALVAPFLALIYRQTDSARDRTVAFFATLVALLVTVVPSTLNYVVYLFFPLLALLYLVEDRPTKLLFVAGLVLVSVPLYPQHVELIVEGVPLSAGVADAVVTGTRSVLRYASVPLWGCSLFFLGALRYVHLPARENRRSGQVVEE
jgi:hypothetical protein